MLRLLRKQTNHIGYMEAKEASEIMENKRAAATKALKEYKASKREYNRIYTLVINAIKTPANDGGF